MKFKVGDKVVVTKARINVKNELRRVGKVFEVEDTSSKFDEEYVSLRPEGTYIVSDDALELEQVFNSPLYKALS